MRPAEAHRHTEALRGADRDVRAQVTGRGEQGQGQQIGGDRDDRAQLVGLLDDGPDVPYRPGRARVLHQDAEDTALGDLRRDTAGQVGDDDLDAGRLGTGLDDRDRLRQGVGVDQEDAVLHLADAPGERHGLGRRGALVEQGGAGGGQPGQLGDHRLEVQERLQAALRDLRLVRRVGRVPGGVLHDVAKDHRRGEGAVVAEPDHRGQHLVAVREGAQLGEDLGLGACGRQPEGLRALDDIGHRGRGELVQRAVTDLGEHLRLRLGIGADMALLERNALLQLGERSATGGHGGGLLVCHDLRGAPRRGCPNGLPLCHLNLRASPAHPAAYRLSPSVRKGSAPALGRAKPALLSRVTSSVRYGGLRDSGEDLLLRRLRISSGGLSRTGSAAATSLPAGFMAEFSSGQPLGSAFL